jgi:outer membrane biosynthesis protein TonB
MQVFEATISFARSRQPREYENARAEISYKVQIEDGEDFQACTAQVLGAAQSTVYEALGMQAQAKRVETTPATQPAPKQEKAPDKPAPKKEEPAQPSAADMSDVADEEPAKEPEPELPEADTSEVAEVSDRDLTSAASKASKNHGAQKVKDLMKEFGVARLGELSQDKRPDFVSRLENLG